MTLENIILTYAIIQIWANTIGLTVLFVLDDLIETRLKEKGYTNIPLQFEDKIKKYGLGILKFIFIPFYYCAKGINTITNNSSFENIINDKIKNGEVIPFIRKKKPIKKEIKTITSQYVKEPLVSTKYKAKNNSNSLYDGKRENSVKFSDELYMPKSLSDITPFAKKERNHLNKEEELFEYVDSLNEKELRELIEALEILKNSKKIDTMNEYKLILDKNEK